MHVVNRGTVWHPEMIEVMNEPQKQNDTMDAHFVNTLNSTRMVPNVDLRPVFRRMYKTVSENIVVPHNGSVKLTLPLNALIGLNNKVLSSPAFIASRMFYAKNVGFKFAIRIRTEKETLQGISASAFYVTPNMVVNDTYGLVTANTINTAAYPGIYTPGQQTPPVPLQFLPVQRTAEDIVYEFVVPNTTYVKYVSSPEHFLKFGSMSLFPAIADCGSIILEFINRNTASLDVVVEINMLTGFTDETRLGLHTVASPFYISKSQSTYLGSGTNPIGLISSQVNPFIYKGGLAP